MSDMRHGTVQMYRKELRKRKTGGPGPCAECRAAQAAYIAEYRAAHGRGLSTRSVHLRARRKALERLVDEYSERFEELIAEEELLNTLL